MNNSMDLRFVVTPTAESVISTMLLARDTNSIALFTGKAGVGKTAIIKHFLTVDRDAQHLTLTPAISNLPSVLRKMAEALGLYPEKKNAYYLNDQIEDQLKWVNRSGGYNLYRGKYIVFDEVQNADLKSLRQVMHYNDLFGFPIIMFGNEYTLKVTRASEAGFDQIDDRIRYRDQVGQSRADIAAICDGWEIRDRDARNWVLAYASNKTLRQLEKLFKATAILAGENSIRVHHLNETLIMLEGKKNAIEIIKGVSKSSPEMEIT